ncbi:zeta toxin family protein [Streptomyces pharetrae]|uniref:zeta toxin family protein n=1 Tax=Streptomyces pharetrae TaxID=291370 RepID=UPI003460427D
MVRQSCPVIVVVTRQPGAAKTEIADLVQAALDCRGGAVRICRDLYKTGAPPVRRAPGLRCPHRRRQSAPGHEPLTGRSRRLFTRLRL